MTYRELQALARENYANGGDVVVECWGESDFEEYLRETGITPTREWALDLFRLYKAHYDDMMGLR